MLWIGLKNYGTWQKEGKTIRLSDKSAQGFTALDLAEKYKREDIRLFLIQNGAKNSKEIAAPPFSFLFSQ